MAVIVLVLVALGWMFWFFRETTIYILITLLAVIILKPIVNYLEHNKIRKSAAFLAIIILFLCLVGITVFYAIPSISAEVKSISDDWPMIQQRINDEVFQKRATGTYYFPALNLDVSQDFLHSIKDDLTTWVNSFAFWAIQLIIGVIFIVPFMVYILLKEGNEIKKRFFSLIPNKYFEVILCMFEEITISIEHFVSAKIIQSAIVALISSIGFLIIGIKFPIVLGIIVGILNIIPYFGPIIGAVPPIAVGYLLHDFRTAFLAFIVILVGQAVDNLYTTPVLLPKLVNEHPLIVIISILVGAELAGPVGMVIALPIYSVFRIILTHSYKALDALHSDESLG